MYDIEIFDGSNWTLASSHTKEVDREAQWHRFIASGMLPEKLRKSESAD